MSHLLFIVPLLCNIWVGFSQDGDTVISPSSKKSIFATSDSSRVRTFIKNAFEPAFYKEEIEDLYYMDYPCGSPSKFRFECGFEIHSPYTPYHPSADFPVEYVESQYAEKWLNLMSSEGEEEGWYYDAILDNSMAFWVTDLADYDGYNEDTVDRLYLQWEWDDKTYYSMFIHNGIDPNDLNQFELISDKFSNKNDEELSEFKTSEPRAFFDESIGINYSKLCSAGGYNLVAIGIRRAVSDVHKNVEWYTTIFSATITDASKQIMEGSMIDANGNKVDYAHILLDSSDGFTVSFYSREGDKDTYGDLSIEDMENGMNKAHGEVILNPFCCVDRWYDMHYAIPLESDVQALSVLDSVMRSGEVYLVYYNQIVTLTTDEDEEDSDESDESDESDGLLDAEEVVSDTNENENDTADEDKNENDNDNDNRLVSVVNMKNVDEVRRLLDKIEADGNEDPSIDTSVGMFWTLVEPNGQMVQVPGIVVDKSDWSTDSGSIVEMFIEPTYWDGNWCPMENTDEYDNYSFGDEIARIEIVTAQEAEAQAEEEEEDEAEEQEKKEDDDEKKDFENEKHKTNNNRLNFNKNRNGFVKHEYERKIDNRTLRYRLVNVIVLFVTVFILVVGCYIYKRSKTERKIEMEKRSNALKNNLFKINKNISNSNRVEYTYKTFQ